MPFTPLAENIWELSHPLPAGPIVLDHRMTVVRLASGQLWVHSPVALDDTIRAGLDALGEVAYFVAPSTFHDLYWPPYFTAYPNARFFAAPGVREAHPDLPFTDVLSADAPSSWSGELDQTLLEGMPKINEVAFLHPASQSLIVADMAFNYDRNVNLATCLMLKMTGCYGRFGVSRLFKLFIKDKKATRRSIDEILSWDFERIIVGHGHLVQSDGRQILKEAYAFLRP
jgi:hypothetical protein